MSSAFSRIVNESIPAFFSITPTAMPENPVPTMTIGKLSDRSLVCAANMALPPYVTNSTIGEYHLSSIILKEDSTFTDYDISGNFNRGEGPHERRRKADHAPAPSRIGREITGRN